MQILAFLLILLKIIGIALLCILLVFIFILVLALLIRVKYNIIAEKSDKLYADIEVTWFIKFVYFRFKISDKEKRIIFKVLWKYLYKDKETFKTTTKKDSEKSEEHPKVERSVSKTRDNNITELEVKTPNEKTEIVNKKTKIVDQEIKKLAKDEEKKIEEELKKDVEEYSIIDKIKQVWNYPNRKEIQDLTIKLIKKLCKALMPKELNLDIEIGSSDPSITGYVLAVSSILVLYFGNDINVRGNFHKRVLNGKIKTKGYFTLGQIVLALLIFAFAKPIRKIIWKYLKTKLSKNKKG